MALHYQLEQTQWLAPGELALAQYRQLQAVLEAAWQTIPYWRDTLAQAGFRPGTRVGAHVFECLPVLERTELQRQGQSLMNRRLSDAHGKVVEAHTSGSTGTPVRFCRTDLTEHFWRALVLREHVWQRRDFSGKLAAIRSNVEKGEACNWGAATEHVVRTGPACTLNIRVDIDEQLDWLAAEDPYHVLTHPSNLRALARRARERGLALPRLKQLRTFGETLAEETIALCREVWDAGIADIYTCEEAGYIASQCERGLYHVQAENLIVEVVARDGTRSGPGETGRVLVTTLHNFAMPLIRYALGDYAEVAGPCACGRGLPALRRILGRTRNMLRLPDGTQHWPSLPEERWVNIAPVRQLQAVQRALDHIVIRVRAERALTAPEKAALIATFQDTLKFPHRITIEEPASISQPVNGKFEDFVSEID